MRKANLAEYRMELINEYLHPGRPHEYSSIEVPTVEVTMPEDDWHRVIAIIELYERDVRHPALQDLVNQYHEMKCLLGE